MQRTQRTLLTFAVLAALLAAAPAARADDDAAAVQAKAAIDYFKKYEKKAKDPTKWADLVMELARTKHPLAADELGKFLMRDKELEHQMILAGALQEFRGDKAGAEAAGKVLHEALDKGKFENEVIDSIVNAIGILEYKPACMSLCDLLGRGGDPFLLITTVRAVGNLRDMRALPTLLELWERHPVGYSWETGEVSVDTGASGTADQEAAEAAWHAKYDSQMKGKKSPAQMFKVYIQELVKSVEKITGEKIETAAELRTWMEEHVEELKKLGVEIPKYKGPPRKDEDKDGKDKK